MAQHQREHKEDLAYLISAVQQGNEQGKRVVVITHHAPTTQGTSHPMFTGSPYTCGFSSDVMSKVTAAGRVELWVFGHTHFSVDRVEACGTRLVSNQIGYKGEEEMAHFRPGFTVTL